MAYDLGRVGVWTGSYLWNDGVEAIAELERLGYGAVWLGSADPSLGLASDLLGASTRIVVATGIVNVYTVPAAALAESFARLGADRFLLGLGNSHASAVEALGKTYTRPLQFLAGYLDELDAAGVPADRRVLAALGPKALRLAAERSVGAHPYLVTPEHTRHAREVLGTGPLLAPEQKVILETDAAAARELARAHLRTYLRLPNYVNNWLRSGFGADDVTGGGSDRLVDALYAWGTLDQLAARVAEHHDAGADHVAVHVVSRSVDPVARRGRPTVEEWRILADVLL